MDLSAVLGDCLNTCASNELCSGNVCICDVENECNGYECSIGCNRGDCLYTCSSNELCSENVCICDVVNECNRLECGTGFCGGECPNTCPSGFICYENKCGCPDGFTEFAGKCIDCPATFENCIDCTLTACTYCSKNYHPMDNVFYLGIMKIFLNIILRKNQPIQILLILLNQVSLV